MSILITKNAVSIIYITLPAARFNNSVSIAFIFIIDIFYPTGELISLQSLCCSPLVVDHYSHGGPLPRLCSDLSS